MELDTVCRLCMVDNDAAFINIYEEQSTVTRIWNSLRLKVFPEDGLPRAICHKCWTNLMKLDLFVTKAHLSQAHLLKIYGKNAQVVDIQDEPAQSGIGCIVAGSERSLDCTASEVNATSADGLTTTSSERIVDLIDSENESVVCDEIFFNTSRSSANREPLLPSLPSNTFPIFNIAVKNVPNSQNKVENLGQIPASSNSTDEPWRYTLENSKLTFRLSNTEKLQDATSKGEANAQSTVSSSEVRQNTAAAQSSTNGSHNSSWTGARSIPTSTKETDLNVNFNEHSDTECECKVCDKILLKSNLEAHYRRYHSVVETFVQCEHCNKKFDSLKLMQLHLPVHFKGGKPFKCTYCDKRYSFSWQKAKHENSHNNKDLACTVCGKTFLSKSFLINHTKVHVKEYLCTICDRKFSSNKYLQRHIMIKHNDPSTDAESEDSDIENEENESAVNTDVAENNGENAEDEDIECIFVEDDQANSEHQQTSGSNSEVQMNNTPSSSTNLLNEETTCPQNTLDVVTFTELNSSYIAKRKAKKHKINLVEMSKKHHNSNESFNKKKRKSYICSFNNGNIRCFATYPNIYDLMDHEVYVHGIQKIYSCITCMKMFTLQVHLGEHHSECKGST